MLKSFQDELNFRSVGLSPPLAPPLENISGYFMSDETLKQKKLKNIDQEKGWMLLMLDKILSVTSVTQSVRRKDVFPIDYNIL